MPSITLSTKGQVVIPKGLREARNWQAGVSLVVEEWPQGLLLRPTHHKPFAPSSLEQVMGSARYQGPALSEQEIADAVGQMLRKRVAPK